MARDRPDLQAYFDDAFAGMPEVRVIRDRRIGESGEPGEGRCERRDRYVEIQERGFVIIRIW